MTDALSCLRRKRQGFSEPGSLMPGVLTPGALGVGSLPLLLLLVVLMLLRPLRLLGLEWGLPEGSK